MKRLIYYWAVVLVFFACQVHAYPFNQRPVSVENDLLQNFFNSIGAEEINVNEDQLPYAIFTPGSDLVFTCTLKSGPNGNTLGIYPYGNPDIKLELIPSSASIGNMAFVIFEKTSLGYSASLIYYDRNNSSINFQSNVITFPTTHFGFYLTDGTYTWYSEDNLNNEAINNGAHVLVFDGASTNDTGDFYLAWEASPLGTSYDYADAVYLVAGDDPVPEPSTLLLLGTGCLGLAGLSRKFHKRK